MCRGVTGVSVGRGSWLIWTGWDRTVAYPPPPMPPTASLEQSRGLGTVHRCLQRAAAEEDLTCPLILGHLDLNNSTPPATVTGRHSGSLHVLFYFDLRDGSREPASNFVSRKHKLLFLPSCKASRCFSLPRAITHGRTHAQTT